MRGGGGKGAKDILEFEILESLHILGVCIFTILNIRLKDNMGFSISGT